MFKRTFYFLFVLGLLAFIAGSVIGYSLLIASMAHAADAATTVTVPIGDWINQLAPVILEITGAAVTALFAWSARFLPASVTTLLRTLQAEQLLTRAIQYGVNAVAGAEAGKVLTVPLGNAVLAQSVQYIEDHAPGWLVSWLGGRDALAQKIIARLNLVSDASVATTASVQIVSGTATAAAPAT